MGEHVSFDAPESTYYTVMLKDARHLVIRFGMLPENLNLDWPLLFS
jgi:hypothetical protein